MEAVRIWAFSLCSGVAVCGIALQLMPKTNLTATFKLVVSVFFLCCLLSPVLLRLTSGQLYFENYSNEIAAEKAERLKEVVEKQTALSAERTLAKIIEDKLRQMGINYHSIAININTNGQSEDDCTVNIIMDKNRQHEYAALKKQIEDALQMSVTLDFAEE